MSFAIGLELRSLWLQGMGEDHNSNLPHLGLDCWSPTINIGRDPRWGRMVKFIFIFLYHIHPSSNCFFCT